MQTRNMTIRNLTNSAIQLLSGQEVEAVPPRSEAPVSDPVRNIEILRADEPELEIAFVSRSLDGGEDRGTPEDKLGDGDDHGGPGSSRATLLVNATDRPVTVFVERTLPPGEAFRLVGRLAGLEVVGEEAESAAFYVRSSE